MARSLEADHTYETNLSQRFATRAGLYGSGFKHRERAAWLQLMQHHGLPTRLLDWSRSPLVAAYFAVEPALTGEANPTAAIWMLAPHEMNLASAGYDFTPSVESRHVQVLVDGAFTGDHDARFASAVRENRWRRREEKFGVPGHERSGSSPRQPSCVAVMASETDLRMVVQQGAFTVHSSDCPPMDQDPGVRDHLTKFVITDVAGLAEELSAAGFTEAGIYPDLDHLGSELTRAGKRVGRPHTLS